MLFGLFATSSLPFIYIFSFMNKTPSTVVRVLIYATLFLGIDSIHKTYKLIIQKKINC